MKYGTLTIAKEYQERNKIEEWLQLEENRDHVEKLLHLIRRNSKCT